MSNNNLPNLSDMPYYKTSVDSEKTKAEIINLLKKYKITNHQWTSLNGNESLRFIINVENSTWTRKIAVEMQIPVLYANYNRSKVRVPENQVMRMFWYSLKSLLESTTYGFIKVEDIFFSYIRTQLPNGEVKTVKEFFLEGGNNIHLLE